MSDPAPPPTQTDMQADLADLRLALMRSEARLTALRQSEHHERALRAAAEQRLDHLETPPPPPVPDPPFDPAPLHARIAQQDLEHIQLEQHLAAFQDSAIWRATWPLRRLLDRYPGLASTGRRALRAGWWTLTLQWPARLRQRTEWRRLAAHAADAPIPEPDLLPEPPPQPPVVPDPGLSLPTGEHPLVSVIVPCFGQVPTTLRCLRAIAASQTKTPYEVIVAEDASGDPALAELALVGGLILVRNPANLGFLHNCNEAALRARGRYILFLNNDTEPMPGFLDSMVRLAEALPDAGLVGSKLLFPDGRLQEAGGIVWRDGTGWNYGRGDDPGLPQYNTVRETDYVSGACMLIRRDLFESLGGFDPLYAPAYYEDTDLAFRVRAGGRRVIYQPASVVIHHEGVSHGTDPDAGIKAHQEINRHRLVARWPRLLASEHAPSGTDVMRAAEHAVGRSTILVIDHYVPEPDRDAGSRSTMAILAALKDAGWLVKFWPQNRARNQYTHLLETMGVEVLDDRLPMRFEDWILRHGPVLDHVLTMRPTVAPEFLSGLLTRTRARLSFYGHDVHHVRMRRQAALLADPVLAGDAIRDADAMERRERALWALFDVMLYPSRQEAALVRAAVPGAEAAAIVPYGFDRFHGRPAPPAAREILFVAGFAHPPNIDAALWLAREILPLVRIRVPDATLVLAGSHPTPSVLALHGPGLTVTGSLDTEALERCYRSARTAIVPLRAGAGVKGKVVEALQQGLPLVTTPIGAEGIDGLDRIVPVAENPETLADALALLLTDDAAWRMQSSAQTAFAAERFSRAALAASLFAALERKPAVSLA